jgi:F-type H+-transporting ATPase subunit delta
MPESHSTASRRYAEALWQCVHQASFEQFAKDLELAVELTSSKGAERFLDNPALPARERQEVLDRVLQDRVAEPVQRLVDLMVQRGKVDKLADIAAEYRRLLNRQQGVVDAVARTALPLSAEETEALQRKMTDMTGREVHLTVEVDPALIGGLTVRVGDTLYDASVRGRLERLRERLVAGAK